MCVYLLAMSKRKALYNLSIKLKAVKRAEDKTKEAAAHKFKVDPRRICEWCQDEKLVDLKKQGKSRGVLLQHSPSRSVIAHLPLT